MIHVGFRSFRLYAHVMNDGILAIISCASCVLMNLFPTPSLKSSRQDVILGRILIIIFASLFLETVREFQRQPWSFFVYKDIIETIIAGVVAFLVNRQKMKASTGLLWVVYVIMLAILVSVYPRLVIDETDVNAYFLRVQLVAVAISFTIGIMVHRFHLIMALVMNTLFMVLFTIWAPEYRFVELMFYLVFIFGVSYLSYRLHLHLQMLNDELTKANASIKEQNEFLEAKNLRKDQLIRIIGHDVSAPFAQISGLIELLDEDDLDKAERTEILRRVRMANAHGRRVLKNILAWAHLQEGAFRQMMRCDDIRKYVDAAIDFNLEILKDKSIKVDMEWNDTFSVVSNGEAVEAIIRNFISNAWKYSNEGQDIAIKAKKVDGEVLISVSDYGVGMSPEILNMIKQGSAVTSSPGTSKELGNGLGLMICFHLARMINGRIEVDSKEGHGSTFTLVLPAV